MVLDQVVVTGFGGMAWWLGRGAVGGFAAKKTHVVYYEGDGTKVAINLSRKSYGPAKTTPAARGSAETVEFGWMLALPTEVAAAAGVRHGLRVRTTDGFYSYHPWQCAHDWVGDFFNCATHSNIIPWAATWAHGVWAA